jgi:hypothetical protein
MEYLPSPFVEVEIRFGTLGKNFDSSIDKRYFEQIYSVLQSNQDWVSVTESKSNEIISENVKFINGTEVMMKENVYTKTVQLENSPFDIRFSVNQEIKLSDAVPGNVTITRNKQRKTFLHNNFKYDLTFVKETLNNVTKEKYELELELLVNKETLSWDKKYVMDFIECKIYDIMNIVEPTTRETFKINLN